MWFTYRKMVVHEKQQNKLVELKAFVDTVRIKSADLKNKFSSSVEFCGFPCFLDVGKGRRLPYVAFKINIWLAKC